MSDMSDTLLADLEPQTSPAAPTSPLPSRRRRRVVVAGLLAAAAGYSWFASDLDVSRFMPVIVGVPMLAAAIAAFRSWVHHDRKRASASDERHRFGVLHRRSVLTWSVLAALLIGWELRELTGSPRVDYPTVTSIVGNVTSFRPVYALAFLAWLVLGYRLIERSR
jgi:uncharacterized membrane protein HdeD (DUF308 family)